MRKFLFPAAFIIASALIAGCSASIESPPSGTSGYENISSDTQTGTDDITNVSGTENSEDSNNSKNPVNILLVNMENPLSADYQPQKLVNLYNYKDRHFSLSRSDIRLEEIAYEAAEEMFAAATANGVEGFIITSGYRDKSEQASIYDSTTNGTAAPPGYSEHETGYAFDVTAYNSEAGFQTTPQFEWLYKNCWDYGFILRYPEDKSELTGIPYEPWHYRYVGLPHSQIIRDKNLTLEEYLAS